MKLLPILLIILLVFCSVLAGCSQGREMHSITTAGVEWYYNPPPETARAGKKVTVRTFGGDDLGYLFLVNGKEPDDLEVSDKRKYIQFRFTMPDEDIRIDFKTYSSRVPDGNCIRLIESWWLLHPEADRVSVKEYFDEYESGAVAAMMGGTDHTAAEWDETVAGCRFAYQDGNRVQVLYEKAFYTLPEACEKGYLTDKDVKALHDLYTARHPELYGENGTS